MASIYKRKNENGTTVWRAVIRIKGYPSISNHFERKQEAEDWVKETERRIKLGQFNFAAHNKHHTYTDLLHRMEGDGAFDLQRSFKNCRSQFDYWKQRLGAYALIHITPELIAQERKTLIDSLLPDGFKRSSATVNRYTAVLSATFGYAVKKLRWMVENPCRTLSRLKESAGRDRILTDEEIVRLLDACKQSKSSFLYPIVLFALTTGARRGEILNLEWRHIDLEKGIAFLSETKNGRPRSVALSDAVIAELKALHEARNPSKPLVFASKTAFGRIDIKKSWGCRQSNALASLTITSMTSGTNSQRWQPDRERPMSNWQQLWAIVPFLNCFVIQTSTRRIVKNLAIISRRESSKEVHHE
jgi:integrase